MWWISLMVAFVLYDYHRASTIVQDDYETEYRREMTHEQDYLTPAPVRRHARRKRDTTPNPELHLVTDSKGVLDVKDSSGDPHRVTVEVKPYHGTKTCAYWMSSILVPTTVQCYTKFAESTKGVCWLIIIDVARSDTETPEAPSADLVDVTLDPDKRFGYDYTVLRPQLLTRALSFLNIYNKLKNSGVIQDLEKRYWTVSASIEPYVPNYWVSWISWCIKWTAYQRIKLIPQSFQDLVENEPYKCWILHVDIEMMAEAPAPDVQLLDSTKGYFQMFIDFNDFVGAAQNQSLEDDSALSNCIDTTEQVTIVPPIEDGGGGDDAAGPADASNATIVMEQNTKQTNTILDGDGVIWLIDTELALNKGSDDFVAWAGEVEHKLEEGTVTDFIEDKFSHHWTLTNTISKTDALKLPVLVSRTGNFLTAVEFEENENLHIPSEDVKDENKWDLTMRAYILNFLDDEESIEVKDTNGQMWEIGVSIEVKIDHPEKYETLEEDQLVVNFESEKVFKKLFEDNNSRTLLLLASVRKSDSERNTNYHATERGNFYINIS